MPQAKLNKLLQDEINRLAQSQQIEASILENFAQFVIENHKKKDKAPAKPALPAKQPKVKPLALAKIKEAVYQYFRVRNTTELKKSGSFKMATDGMNELNLSVKETWEVLYRKFIGILPGEEDQQGYGCINGINVFNYFRPWQVFNLDPQKATLEDIKQAYRELSKVYHPDVPGTGDARVFEQINIMYKSISAKA